jgi:hypothetical protein
MIRAVAEGAGGTIYLCGSIARSATWRARPITAGNGARDGVVLAVSPRGDLLWHAVFGDAGDDLVAGGAVDAAGDLRVCGSYGAIGARAPRRFARRLTPEGTTRDGGELGDGAVPRCDFDREGNLYAIVERPGMAAWDPPRYPLVATSPEGRERWRIDEASTTGTLDELDVSPSGRIVRSTRCPPHELVCGGITTRLLDRDGTTLWTRSVRIEGFVTCWGSVSWGAFGHTGFDGTEALYESIAAHIGTATYDNGLMCAGGGYAEAVCRGDRAAGGAGLTLAAISPSGVPSIADMGRGPAGAAPWDWVARRGVVAWRCAEGICQSDPARGRRASTDPPRAPGVAWPRLLGAVGDGLVFDLSDATSGPARAGVGRITLPLVTP